MNKLKYFFKVFLPEVRSEWGKVTKPGRPEVVATTVVVIVTSFVFAIYLFFADLVIVSAMKASSSSWGCDDCRAQVVHRTYVLRLRRAGVGNAAPTGGRSGDGGRLR